MPRLALAVRDLFRTGLDVTGRMPSPMLLLLVPLFAVLAYGAGTVLRAALTAVVTAVALVLKAGLCLAALGVAARLAHRLADQHLRAAPPVAPSDPREPVT